MQSGSQYCAEEKVTRTEIIELLLSAKETVFTVTYRKKVDTKGVEKALKEFTSSDLSRKQIVELLSEGDKDTITCFLSSS
tara:strand:- start:42 stop:281 length:240 start_codon:yes stop_codon:yes gene_type:complete